MEMIHWHGTDRVNTLRGLAEASDADFLIFMKV